MNIDELIKLTKNYINGADNKPSLEIDSYWAQGRTVYGGITAALVYTAIKEKVSSDRVLRSFTCNFVGPLIPGQPFDIEVEVLRQGRNATHTVAKAMQDGKVCLLMQACFGVARQSKVRVDNNDMHNLSVPIKAKQLSQTSKTAPKFLQHFDLVTQQGDVPFSASDKSEIQGWMKFSKAPAKLTDAHIIALIDAWPPAVLQMVHEPAPVSTMSWNIEFIYPHHAFSATDWLAYKVHTRQAADGYAHTEANIWDAQGQLIAISRQTVMVFD